MREIPINQIEGILVGHADNYNDGTGCSVIICENGAATGVSICGGGPASRETQLLNSLAAADKIHAVVLSGGSAFGLCAANGVMKYLVERNIGFDTGIKKVPLVCQSAIFDLVVGCKDAFPDEHMAYKACLAAEKNMPHWGNVGAGMGATIGKIAGKDRMMKAGIGAYALQIGSLQVGAMVVVNALGDIFDIETHQQIGGLLSEDKSRLDNSEEHLFKNIEANDKFFATNTTIGVVVTNASFTKTEMNKVAAMSQNGLARTIAPVHTTADGDTMYAMSLGDFPSNTNVVGTLASRVTAMAIKNAVISAKGAYGLKAYADLIVGK